MCYLTRYVPNNCNFCNPRRFQPTHPIYFAAINLICGYCHTFLDARALDTTPGRNWSRPLTPLRAKPRQIVIRRYKSNFIGAPSRPSIYRRPWVGGAATIEPTYYCSAPASSQMSPRANCHCRQRPASHDPFAYLPHLWPIQKPMLPSHVSHLL